MPVSRIAAPTLCTTAHDVPTVFHNPNSTILGLMSSLYSLGSIASLPFVPWVSDRFGRRMAILFGSAIMIVGAILQMAAQDCTSPRCLAVCRR